MPEKEVVAQRERCPPGPGSLSPDSTTGFFAQFDADAAVCT